MCRHEACLASAGLSRHDSGAMSAISQEVTEALKTTSIASLLEYVIREIAMTDGEVVLEVVFSVGRFRRGYVRSGLGVGPPDRSDGRAGRV